VIPLIARPMLGGGTLVTAPDMRRPPRIAVRVCWEDGRGDPGATTGGDTVLPGLPADQAETVTRARDVSLPGILGSGR
jgi:hypothetical protein